MTTLTDQQQTELLTTLQKRFKKHPERHPGIDWTTVQSRLEKHPHVLTSVHKMEHTGGEPDLVVLDANDSAYLIIDCAAESPKGRRSCCYDQEALEARKKFPPETSAVQLASEMGIELLDEAHYRLLQTVGEFDRKTSSWIKTPDAIREKGGALFCDRRYDTVFTYHNGADSYYGARAFRGMIKL